MGRRCPGTRHGFSRRLRRPAQREAWEGNKGRVKAQRRAKYAIGSRRSQNPEFISEMEKLYRSRRNEVEQAQTLIPENGLDPTTVGEVGAEDGEPTLQGRQGI